jgi:hypothetical protein
MYAELQPFAMTVVLPSDALPETYWLHQPSTNRTLAIATSEAVDSPSLLLLVASAHLILHDDSCHVMLHVTLPTVGAHSRSHGKHAPCWALCACCLRSK